MSLDIEQMVREKMVPGTDIHGLRLWTCSDCGYKSKKSTDVYKHIQRVHMDIAVHCPHCGQKFKSVADVKSHVRRVHAEIELSFDC